MIFVDYVHYKGGTYNLKVAIDSNGRFATSLKDENTAIKNYKRKYKIVAKNENI